MPDNDNGKIRVAVIGVGHLGQHHARILSEMKGVDLACIVDSDEERGKEISAKLSIPTISRCEDIPDDIGAVSIVTPTSTHHAVAMEMLNAGRDVMVEKPISVSIEEAKEMTDFAEAKGRILQVGHIERFNPAVLAVAEQLNKPMFIESHRLGTFTPRVKDIGVVLDLMIHDIDLVCSLVNSPIASLESVGVPVLTEREDIANARIRFESGCIANLTVSRVSMQPMRKIRIFQKDTYFSLDYMNKEAQIYKRLTDDSGKMSIDRQVHDLSEQDALTCELASFIDCVRTRKRPIVSGKEGGLALELAIKVTEEIEQRLQQLGMDS